MINDDDDNDGGELVGGTHIHKGKDGGLAPPETEPITAPKRECLKCRDHFPIAALPAPPRGYIFPCIRGELDLCNGVCDHAEGVGVYGDLDCLRKVGNRRQPPLEGAAHNAQVSKRRKSLRTETFARDRKANQRLRTYAV